MAGSWYFFPYKMLLPSVGRQKMIISVLNLLFTIYKQTLYDYPFFQTHSFLMPFYSVIKLLWYDSSSFIQARIVHSQRYSCPPNPVIVMWQSFVMSVQILYKHSTSSRQEEGPSGPPFAILKLFKSKLVHTPSIDAHLSQLFNITRTSHSAKRSSSKEEFVRNLT